MAIKPTHPQPACSAPPVGSAAGWACFAAALLAGVIVSLVGLPALGADELRTPAEGRVIQLTLPVDNQRVTGEVVGYNPLLFTLQTEAGQTHRVLWNVIPADRVDRYWRYLEQPEQDAKKLVELGSILAHHSQGEALAEQAFDQALALDASLAEAVEQAREGRHPDGTPRYVGTGDPQRWGELTEAQMDEGAESLRRFATRTQDELAMPLSLYESERFMLLTDAEAEQVAPIAKKLNLAYRAAAELLGEDPDDNLFYGKCMVVLFDERVDYYRFQQTMHDTDARGTGGLCHSFGDGHARVALFSRPSARQTHHILIHEFVHAYLHRYQSPEPLPDWVNEGLAEHLAHKLEPPPGDNLALKSRLSLAGKRGLGEGFFDDQGLDAWQYDTAGALAGFLIERYKPERYASFVQSIKSGQTAEQALKDTYRMTPARLTQMFKRYLDHELNKKLGG